MASTKSEEYILPHFYVHMYLILLPAGHLFVSKLNVKLLLNADLFSKLSNLFISAHAAGIIFLHNIVYLWFFSDIHVCS